MAAPDKFRGTATATQVAGAIARAAADGGHACDRAPVADGGEGLLECFGGPNRESTVSDPSGRPVVAAWCLEARTAIIEMARASGLALAGSGHDPLAASTTGTGELIAAALDAGARLVIVGAGGSATTDGGVGAVDALRHYAPLDGTHGYVVRVAADVRTSFVHAAEVFAPQKGARPDQVRLLTERLHRLRDRYRDEFGVDVEAIAGSGAAGGLAGGLLALGAELRSGFDIVAEQLHLAERIAAADLVLTGEGRFDPTSMSGKSVGGVASLCRTVGTPVVVIAGEVSAAPDDPGFQVVSLTERFGAERARTDAPGCIRAVASELISAAVSEATL